MRISFNTCLNYTNTHTDGEDFSFPKFADSKEAESILGPIASASLQRNGVFKPHVVSTSISHPPANNTTYAFTNRDSYADPAMTKLLSETVSWTPVQLSQDISAKTADLVENIPGREKPDNKYLGSRLENLNILSSKPLSSREQHEKKLWAALGGSASTDIMLAKLKRLIIRRCKNGYLFDYAKNRSILTDDPWLQDVWQWVEG